jgi:hypothetical protein
LIKASRSATGEERRSDRYAHRSAHEGEVLHSDNRLAPVDEADGIDQGVALAGGRAGRLQAIRVALAVAEAQRVFANLRCR